MRGRRIPHLKYKPNRLLTRRWERGPPRQCDYTPSYQFSVVFVALSITKISTGPFFDSSFRPDCSEDRKVQTGGEGGFEHDPQQSSVQLADSTLPRWLSMPRLPWLLGPYWPMARFGHQCLIPLSWGPIGPRLRHVEQFTRRAAHRFRYCPRSRPRRTIVRRRWATNQMYAGA